MSRRVIRAWRDGRLVALSPALVIAATALFALPHQAGGYRLAKWGAFGAALALSAIALLIARVPLRAPRAWYAPAAFVGVAALLPAFSSALAPTHWPTAAGFVCGLALFLVTAAAVDGEARRESFVVLTATGAVCAVVVLSQVAGLRWLTSEVYTDLEFRAPGTFGNPNWAAAFLAPLVPLSLALAATAGKRRLHLGVAALLAVATVATLSKGGVVTLIAGWLVYCLLDRGMPTRARLGVLGGVVACMVVGLVFAWQHELFTTAPWLRGRIFLWRVALYLIGAHPAGGVGLGGYVPAYGEGAAVLVHGDAGAFIPLSSVDFAHNDLLQLAAEGGLLTAVTFAALIVSALKVTDDPLARAASAAIAAIGVNGLADSPLRVPSTFVLLFFLLGWRASGGPSVRRAWPVWVTIAALGIVQSVRFTAGDAYWTLGRDALRANQPAVADLARARFFMPEHGRSASHHARALARAGRIGEALEVATRAATLRFDFDDEIFRRDLEVRTLEREAAIQTWQELSARFPMLVTPHLRLGALYLQANDRAAAIGAYETVLASSQSTKRADEARAQARGVLRSLLSRTPEDP